VRATSLRARIEDMNLGAMIRFSVPEADATSLVGVQLRRCQDISLHVVGCQLDLGVVDALPRTPYSLYSLGYDS
jgi:hypothetical protein